MPDPSGCVLTSMQATEAHAYRMSPRFHLRLFYRDKLGRLRACLVVGRRAAWEAYGMGVGHRQERLVPWIWTRTRTRTRTAGASKDLNLQEAARHPPSPVRQVRGEQMGLWARPGDGHSGHGWGKGDGRCSR